MLANHSNGDIHERSYERKLIKMDQCLQIIQTVMSVQIKWSEGLYAQVSVKVGSESNQKPNKNIESIVLLLACVWPAGNDRNEHMRFFFAGPSGPAVT